MSRMRIWDCGGTWTLVRLGRIEDLSNAQQVICQLTHTHTQTQQIILQVFLISFFVFVSVFTQIYNLFKFAIASTFKRRDFCSFLLFCRAFLAVVFSLHLFKVIYCRLFTACCLLSTLLLSGQLWNLFQLANFGASATPFTVAVRPVTKQLDTCHKLHDSAVVGGIATINATRSRMPHHRTPPRATNAFLRYCLKLRH